MSASDLFQFWEFRNFLTTSDARLERMCFGFYCFPMKGESAKRPKENLLHIVENAAAGEDVRHRLGGTFWAQFQGRGVWQESGCQGRNLQTDIQTVLKLV